MRRQQKRYRDLIEAGRRVMAEKGYEDANVSDIVRQASVAQDTFYLYFPTWLDLVIAFAREMQQEIFSRVQVEINKKDVLDDLMTSVAADSIKRFAHGAPKCASVFGGRWPIAVHSDVRGL